MQPKRVCRFLFALLAGASVGGAIASAQAPAFVRDLRTSPGLASSSDPGGFIVTAGGTYFAATTAADGRELWRTDGTPAGTIPLVGLAPGSGGSNPRSFATTADGRELYFIADDGDQGPQVYRVVTTPASPTPLPVRVTNLTPAVPTIQSGAQIDNLVRAGDNLFFVVRASAGPELWRVGLTGNRAVARVFAFTNAAALASLTPARQYVYFAGFDGDLSGVEPWRSDGVNTLRVTDVNPRSGSSNPANFTTAGDFVYFSAVSGPGSGRAIYRSEIASRTTTLVGPTHAGADTAPWAYTLVNGGLVYFRSPAGFERTDGTLAGTILLRSATTPAATANSRPAALGSLVFFAAEGSGGSVRPWVTDGTLAGTQELAPLALGDNRVRPGDFAAHDGAVYFAAVGAYGRELYRSQGTLETTTLVKDLAAPADASGSTDSDPRAFASTPQGLLFAATVAPTGGELYVSDGTETGTHVVANINPEAATRGSEPYAFRSANGRAFFAGVSPTNPALQSLFVSDGTPKGTRDVFTPVPPDADSRMRAMGGILYFAGTTASFGTELYRSDGTPRGTFLVADVAPGRDIGGAPFSSNPRMLTQVGNRLAFLAETSAGATRLWSTDGTPGGLRMLAAAQTVLAPLSDDGQLPTFGRECLIISANPSGLPTLYRVDVTTGAPTPIYSAPADGGFSGVRVAGGRVYFVVRLNAAPSPPMTLFGANLIPPSGVSTILPAPAGDTLEIIGSADGTAYFRQVSPQPAPNPTRVRLYSISGFGLSTQVLSSFNPPNPSAASGPTAAVGSRLFFTASTPSGGRELWTSDGTPETTRLLREIGLRDRSALPQPGPVQTLMRRVGNFVYFVADNGEHGAELWRTNGTADGTVRVSDIRLGAPSSNPRLGAWIGNQLFFGADDGEHGSEPFVLSVCPADFDANGTLDPDDMSEFIAAYFLNFSQGRDQRCDWNGDGVIDPDDIADYLLDYFNGCQ